MNNTTDTASTAITVETERPITSLLMEAIKEAAQDGNKDLVIGLIGVVRSLTGRRQRKAVAPEKPDSNKQPDNNQQTNSRHPGRAAQPRDERLAKAVNELAHQRHLTQKDFTAKLNVLGYKITASSLSMKLAGSAPISDELLNCMGKILNKTPAEIRAYAATLK